MKVRMVVELEYDEDVMHGDCEEAEAWFFDEILGGKGGLSLHSNEIGDTVGSVTVLTVERK